MAGKGIVINFISDIRRFLKGTDDIGEALDQVSDSLDDVARDGDKATEKLERSFKDLTKVVDRESDEAGDKMVRNFKRSGDRVESQLDEVTNEAKQNAAEMFSSFDGSFESIADAAQSTLGGLVGGLRGIPAIAAVAAGAAGLGLVTTTIVNQLDSAKELKESLAEAYKAAAEEGRNYLDEATIIAAAAEILFDSSKRDAAAADAAKIGVDTNTYIRALAGDADALEYAIAQATSASGDLVHELDSARGGESWSPAVIAIDTVRDKLIGLSDTHAENRDAASQYQDLIVEQSAEQRDEVARVRSVEEQRWDALGRRYSEAAGRAPITIRTELAEPDTEAIRRSTQGSFDRNPLVVRARLVTREGREVGT
jgi:hypothetical protein